MDKQELFIKLAEIVKSSNSTEEQVSKAKLLTSKVMYGKISVDEATQVLSDIEMLSKNPMIDHIITKSVGKSLVKYYKGKLIDRMSILKMLSSLYTHALIELETTGKSYDNSLDLLCHLSHDAYFNSQVDTTYINSVLLECGLGESQVMHTLAKLEESSN